MQKSFLTTLLCASTALATLGQSKPAADSTKAYTPPTRYIELNESTNGVGAFAHTNAQIGGLTGTAYSGLWLNNPFSRSFTHNPVTDPNAIQLILGGQLRSNAPQLGKHWEKYANGQIRMDIFSNTLSGILGVGVERNIVHEDNKITSIFVGAGIGIYKKDGILETPFSLNAGFKMRIKNKKAGLRYAQNN